MPSLDAKKRARMADWAPYGRVPEASLPLFGADPCHSPAREGVGVPKDGPCPRCERPDTPDPVRLYAAHVSEHGASRAEPLVTVCPVCNRTPYEGTGALDKATKPDDGLIREGYETLDGADTDKRDAANRTAEAVRRKR